MSSVACSEFSRDHRSISVLEFYWFEEKLSLANRLSFWKMVNNKVKNNGPLSLQAWFSNPLLKSKRRCWLFYSTKIYNSLNDVAHEVRTEVGDRNTWNNYVEHIYLIENEEAACRSNLFFGLPKTSLFQTSLKTVRLFNDFTFESSPEHFDYDSALKHQFHRNSQSDTIIDDNLTVQ